MFLIYQLNLQRYTIKELKTTNAQAYCKDPHAPLIFIHFFFAISSSGLYMLHISDVVGWYKG